MFSSEANCMQFLWLYDLKILRTNHQCPRCRVPMALQECPATKYREGCCWKCKCRKTIAPRVGSILENSHVTYEEFIKILAYFAWNYDYHRRLEVLRKYHDPQNRRKKIEEIYATEKISRRTWHRKRPIAELQILDSSPTRSRSPLRRFFFFFFFFKRGWAKIAH